MANTISSDLQVNTVLRSALRAMSARVLPLKELCTSFRDVPLNGTDIVAVPFYPLETAASTNFNGTYAMGNTTTNSRPVTINKRKYQSLGVTSSEWNRQPNVDWEMLGKIKGEKLAADVVADIFSIVTNANYGAATYTGAATAFDTDDIIDIRAAAMVANWPDDGRTLILDSTFDAHVFKDTKITPAYALGSDGVIIGGQLPRVLGFNYAGSALIPANGENLVGFALYRSAILTAFSPVTPEPSVMASLNRYEVMTDPVTGLTLEYREWGNPDTDSCSRVIECNYGYAKGDGAALLRIVTP